MNYNEENQDDLVFFQEEAKESENKQDTKIQLQVGTAARGEFWKILVVDDEEDVHTVTHLTLDDFEFEGMAVKILDAYSAAEAYDLLSEQADIAILLLDVVMETTTAGLDLVKRIREELHNGFVRIILRTGQPGHAPERKVVLNYDINDYKSKTELTADKIFTLVMSGLRAYNSLVTLEEYRQDLQQKVESAVEEIREKDHIIIKQSRQTAISELISNISHQWRQPLNTVMALIQDLEFAEDISLEYVQNQTVKAMIIIQEMSETIDDLRYFFEPVEERQEFSVGEVLDKCLKLLQPTLESDNINLKNTVKQEMQILGYKNDYAQVILQILNNARDAVNSRDGGKEIRIELSSQDGRSLVTISDNGGGISPEIYDHIFEPYVTSKFKSAGKGLSLYMCQMVIEKNMKGKLLAANEGEGAVFKIIT
ncbi:MAG: hybrid sensor histidine kinase/response regulator [Candidatus Cloacimonetes bacterium]|nr:hybrid sensor histidine kinase/response regulator [Candidatus Cloacimonadota bacterium]